MKGQFTLVRLVGLSIVFAAMFAFIAYMVVEYPTAGTPPSFEQWKSYIPEALISVLIVLVVDALTIVAVRKRNRALPAEEKDPAGADVHPEATDAEAPLTLNPVMQAAIDRAVTRETHAPSAKRGWKAAIPNTLSLQAVPLKVVLISMAGSAFLLIGSFAYGFPLWGKALAALIPWLPLFTFEAAWKYKHYGIYAFLLVFTVLQIGHLMEHSVQVGQLLVSGGDATVAHGVFGALDRELVHFAWDSIVWIGICVLLYVIGPHNKWLWISFVAASFHEVEHLFLFYLDRFQSAFYDAGGTTGIFAKGGLIGSPLHRPYLHYVYNFFVVVPLIMALWDETKRAFNIYLAKALPSLTHEEKVTTSSKLERVHFDAGEIVVRQGDTADRFFILASGECDVLATADGGEEVIGSMGPGQFFGELGLLMGQQRTATVRAKTDVEVLSMDADAFTELIGRSSRGAVDVDAALGARLAELEARTAQAG